MVFVMEKFLRLKQLQEVVGLRRSAIYDRIQSGTFPAPVSLGGKAVAWPASEIEAWIDECIRKGRRTVENGGRRA